MKFIVEKDLELRLVSQDLAENLFTLFKENYEHLHTWMIWANEKTDLKSMQKFLKASETNFKKKTEKVFFIYLKDKLVGLVDLHTIDLGNKSAEIGYWLDKKHNGKGIVTKSCKVLINHAFDEMQLNSVRILCASENKKSRAIPEKLDFVEEGTLREIQWMHDHFNDLVVYSMLKKDWTK
jgi:ribosomal-protein-serine acetyltransferase